MGKKVEILEQKIEDLKEPFHIPMARKIFLVLYSNNKTITWVASNSRGYNMGKLLDKNRMGLVMLNLNRYTAGCADLENNFRNFVIGC